MGLPASSGIAAWFAPGPTPRPDPNAVRSTCPPGVFGLAADALPISRPAVCRGPIGARASLQAARVLGRPRQEPVPERRDFRHVRGRARAGDPVGVGHPQGEVERLHRAAIDEVPGREGRAGGRHALPVHRGVDQHARPVQHRAAGNGIAAPGSLDPSRPSPRGAAAGLPGGRTPWRSGSAGEEHRAAAREQPLGAQAHDAEPRPVAVPWWAARSTSSRAKSTWCAVAGMRRSIPGWVPAKRPSPLTSHLAAKFGDALTVSSPEP